MSHKNPYYWTCPYCGANLDLNEKCDCQKDNDKDHRSVDENFIDQSGTHESSSVTSCCPHST